MGIFLENNFKQAEANVTLTKEEQERYDQFKQKCEELRLAKNGEDLRLLERKADSKLVSAFVPISSQQNAFAVMFMLDCELAHVHITYNVGDTTYNMTVMLYEFINMDKFTVRVIAEASRRHIRQFQELEEMRAKFKQNKAETKKELKTLFK